MANERYCPKCGSVLINTIENATRVLNILHSHGLLLNIPYPTSENLEEVQLALIEGLRPLGIYVFIDDPICVDEGIKDVNGNPLIEYNKLTQINARHVEELQKMINYIQLDAKDKTYSLTTPYPDYWITEPTKFTSLLDSSKYYQFTPKHIKELRDALDIYIRQTHPKAPYVDPTPQVTGERYGELGRELWISYDRYGFPLIDPETDKWLTPELYQDVNTSDIKNSKVRWIKARHIEDLRKNKRGYYEQKQWLSALDLIEKGWNEDEYDPEDWQSWKLNQLTGDYWEVRRPKDSVAIQDSVKIAIPKTSSYFNLKILDLHGGEIFNTTEKVQLINYLGNVKWLLTNDTLNFTFSVYNQKGNADSMLSSINGRRKGVRLRAGIYDDVVSFFVKEFPIRLIWCSGNSIIS